MNLRQLRYFVRVVDAENMTRAAEQLDVAQTALGMQIRQIDDDLGIALLVRHSRGVSSRDCKKPRHVDVTFHDSEGFGGVKIFSISAYRYCNGLVFE